MIRPPVTLLQHRAVVLANTWIAVPLAVVLVVGTAWYLRLLPVDLAALAAGATTAGGVALLVSFTLPRVAAPRGLIVVLAFLQAAAAFFLAWCWHLLGGVGLTAAAGLLALVPACATIVPVRGLGPASAGMAGLALWSTAWLESAPLRRLLILSGLPLDGLAARSPFVVPETGVPEDAARTAAGLVVLTGVLLVLGALPAITRTIPARPGRDPAAPEAKALSEATEALALVRPVSGELLVASTGLRDRYLLHRFGEGQPTLSAVLDPVDPAPLATLLEGGGVLPRAEIRIGPEARTVRISCDPFEHDGEVMLLVHLLDLTAD